MHRRLARAARGGERLAVLLRARGVPKLVVDDGERELVRRQGRDAHECLLALGCRRERHCILEHLGHEQRVHLAEECGRRCVGRRTEEPRAARVLAERRARLAREQVADVRRLGQAATQEAVADRAEHRGVCARVLVREERRDRLAPLRVLRVGREPLGGRRKERSDRLGRLARVEAVRDLDAGAVLEHRRLCVVRALELVRGELAHDLVAQLRIEVLRNDHRMRPHLLAQRKLHGLARLALLEEELEVVEERGTQRVGPQRAHLAGLRRLRVGRDAER